ncbi:MAG: DoxX-like family protein [Chlorobiaceae bacterium]|nr:DoxX-like family protein [Chlorobiaceae bacterium]
MMNLFASQSPALLASRIALAFVWIYQGAVPKLVCQSPVELGLLSHLGPLYGFMCSVMGYGEMAFGLLMLLTPWRWPFLLNIAAMLSLFGFVALHEPHLLVEAFNPVTLNVTVIALSIIGWLEMGKASSSNQ